MNSINGTSVPHDGFLADGTQSYSFALCPFKFTKLKARRLYECWFFLYNTTIQLSYLIPPTLYSTLLNTAS